MTQFSAPTRSRTADPTLDGRVGSGLPTRRQQALRGGRPWEVDVRPGGESAQGDRDQAAPGGPRFGGERGASRSWICSEEELATEVRRGIALADAARTADAAHLVYSSVDGAERATGIDHFESKTRIEEHIAGTFPSATILRPVFFMDNLLWYADATDERVLELPVVPDRPMQMIAASDIGRIAAAAFAEPEAYLGTRLAIAGDAVSFEQVAATYQQVTGVRTRLAPKPIEERMYQWFAEDGYQADIPTLRTDFPWLQRFDAFLRKALSAR